MSKLHDDIQAKIMAKLAMVSSRADNGLRAVEELPKKLHSTDRLCYRVYYDPIQCCFGLERALNPKNSYVEIFKIAGVGSIARIAKYMDRLIEEYDICYCKNMAGNTWEVLV